LVFYWNSKPMQYWYLGDTAQEELLNLPETGMGFQIVEALVLGSRKTLVIVGESLALDPSAAGIEFSDDPAAVFANGVKLMEALNAPDRMIQVAAPQPRDFRLLACRVAQQTPQIGGTTQQTNASPLVTQSTLVKTVTLAQNRVFHRFSAFNPDPRVDPATGSFRPGTYAVPESEIPFLPTGFAVVGRLALPSNKPASHHYEIEAPAGTTVQFGTVAPAFGQAGGGVEALFANAVANQKSPPTQPSVIPDE